MSLPLHGFFNLILVYNIFYEEKFILPCHHVKECNDEKSFAVSTGEWEVCKLVIATSIMALAIDCSILTRI